MNWEYVTSVEVAPSPVRGPNAWNTTINTTATMTQSSRFFARSFIGSPVQRSVPALNIVLKLSFHLRQLSLRQRIYLRRPLARGRRRYIHWRAEETAPELQSREDI